MELRPRLDDLRTLPPSAWRRVRADLPRLAQAAVAAAAAWAIAHLLVGHARPVFAPIAALVALSASVGRRGSQAVHMLVGITLGIVIAEALIRGVGSGTWQLGLAVFVGIAVPTALGLPPLVATQAGVWGVIVIAMGDTGGAAALARFEDGVIGAGLALLLVQVVFPADPEKLVAAAATPVYGELGGTLEQLAHALEVADEGEARGALRRVERFDDRRLRDAIQNGREIVRRSPRRRRRRSWIGPYERAAAELDATERDLLVLALTAIRRAREEGPPPHDVVRTLLALAYAYRALPLALLPDEPTDLGPTLEEAQDALERLRRHGPMAGTLLHRQLEALTRDLTRAARPHPEEPEQRSPN